MILSAFLIFFLLTPCINSVEKPQYQGNNIIIDTCHTIQEAQNLKNKEAVIYGRLQKFTPWKEGKGSGHMFWRWEISFPGGGAIPIVSKDKSDGESIIFDEYENRNVIVKGTVFYGIIIGDSDPTHQSATGFRIDADDIMYDVSKPESNYPLDTCRVWKDIEAHYNCEAYVTGKIIEYTPPHDNSKLGDEKIFDWEILTADNYKIPLFAKNKELDINSFNGKNVIVRGNVIYGIIFGYENTANIEGTKIDALEIFTAGLPEPRSKITFNIDDFTDGGLREGPKGEFNAISYEFCIPADEKIFKEVLKIDTTVMVMKGSKGRSGCSDKEWLCIGSSGQPGFKNVILKLAELSCIRKISETFWE